MPAERRGRRHVFVIDEATGNIHVTRAWTGRRRHSTCYWPKPWTSLNRPWSPHRSSLSRCKTSTTTHIFPLGPYHATVPRCPMWGEYLGLDILGASPPLSPLLSAPEPISFNSALLVSGSHSSALLPHLALSWLSGVPEACRDISDPSDCSRRR